jgi:iron complex outermembrane recepter protein
MKKILISSISVIALMGASHAYAQDTGEIIVTAAKRDQSLQSIPISVSVTTGEALKQAQVVDLLDLQSLVPSLKVTQLNTSSQTTFSIRGFSDGNGNLGLENAVGLFVDNVYRSRSISSLSDLPDVERIEVLRGPQTTLFGKNVSVGAISVTTRAPQLKHNVGSVEATYGNYGASLTKASYNVSLGDVSAFKISGSLDNRKGYVDDVVTGGKVNNRNRWQIRGDYLFKPNDKLDIRIIGDYNEIHEICCAVDTVYAGPATQFIAAPVPYGLGDIVSTPAGLQSKQVAYTFDPTNRLIGGGLSGEINYHFNGAKLTSVTSWRRQLNDTNQDVSFTGADLFNNAVSDRIETYTQELRLTSTGKGPLSWVVGAFYANDNASTVRNITYGKEAYKYINGLTGGAINQLESLEYGAQGALYKAGFGPAPTIIPGHYYFQNGQGISDAWTLKDTSYSVFGQADYKLNKDLTATIGLSYINDSKQGSSNVVLNDPFSATDLTNIPLLTILPLNVLGGPYANYPSSVKIPANLFAKLATAGVQPFYAGTTNHGPVNIPNSTEDGKVSGNHVNYSVRMSYAVTPRTNVYASISTGWKAASFNMSSDSRPNFRYDLPETLTNYELGVKSKFHGGYVNLTGFYEVAKDFQTNSFVGVSYALTNAEKESVYGVEFDGGYSPDKHLLFTANVAWLNPKYDSYTHAGCVSFDPQCAPVGTTTPLTRDLSGTVPAGIATWNTTLAAAYKQDLAPRWHGFMRVEWDYASRTNLSDTVAPSVNGTPVGTTMTNQVNANMGVKSDKYRSTLNFWVRNATNQIYLLSGFPTPIQTGSFSGYPSAPRTFGATLSSQF